MDTAPAADLVGVVHESEILRRGIASCLSEDPRIAIVFAIPEGDPPAEANVVVASEDALEGTKYDCPVVVCVERVAPLTRSAPVAAVVQWPSLTASQLIAAVRAAAVGFHVELGAHVQPDATFDRRWIEVLRLLALGGTTRTISEKLFYSERTVKSIIHDLETELRAATRTQAVAEALRRGLI